MSETSYVVVFPSMLAKNKLRQISKNIRDVLTIQNQKFASIKRDGDIILVEANDPVFASSAINLLYGIDKVAIAKRVINDFDVIVSEITSIGGNLLLKGEQFYVKVEGYSRGFLTKDVELAATSSIIEKKASLGARPGTDERHDKLLYTYLTKTSAYICIFIDRGSGGIPNYSQGEKAICCIFDELSAIACLETIRLGYDTRIIVCFRQKGELTSLVKLLNRILPRLVRQKIEIEFYQIGIRIGGISNYLSFLRCVNDILITSAKNDKITHIGLVAQPGVFPSILVDYFSETITKAKLFPVVAISSLESVVFNGIRELYIRDLSKIQKLCSSVFPKRIPQISSTITQKSLGTRKNISVRVGPNNVHDILDALEEH